MMREGGLLLGGVAWWWQYRPHPGGTLGGALSPRVSFRRELAGAEGHTPTREAGTAFFFYWADVQARMPAEVIRSGQCEGLRALKSRKRSSIQPA